MKAVIKENQIKTEKPFPKLMHTDSPDFHKCYVFFFEKGYGMCLKSDTNIHKIGVPIHNWTMSHFTDFNGTVELSND